MTDEPTDGTARKQQAAAAGMAVLLGTAVGGPLGGVVAAAAAPLLVPLAQRVWDELRPEAQVRAGEVLGVAAQTRGVEPDQLVEEILAGTEEQRLLAVLALSAAVQTANHDKIRALARALAAGLAHDDAVVDEEVMIVQALNDLEAPHLGLLDLMATDRLRTWLGGFELQPRPDGMTTPSEWTAQDLERARPGLSSILPTIVNTLHRHGLIERLDNLPKALEHYSEQARRAVSMDNLAGGGSGGPPRVTSGDLRRVRDMASWRVLPFGLRLLEYVREAAHDEQPSPSED